MSEQEQIESVLASFDCPPYVTELRYKLDNDWSGDPGVWIWVILRDDIADSADLRKYTRPVTSDLAQAVHNAGIDRWPYVHIRGQSEQAELDEAEAA